MRSPESDKLMRGFTIIEVLVVVAILAVLATVTIVGLSSAREAGRAATTNSFMQAIVTGLEGFEQDHDFLPASNVPNTATYNQSPMWESSFSDRWYGGEILAQALMGYAQDDSVNPPKALDNHPASGGGYGAKKLNRSDYKYATSGRSFGPYVELKSEESLVKTTDANGNESARFAFSSPSNRNGEPILYFRRDRNPNMTDPVNDPLWGINAAPDRYAYNIEDNAGGGSSVRSNDVFATAASDKAFEYLQTRWDDRKAATNNDPNDTDWTNYQDFTGLETSMKSAEYILIAPGEDGTFGGTADTHDDIVITGN